MKKLIALMVMLSMVGFTACKGEDVVPPENQATFCEC